MKNIVKVQIEDKKAEVVVITPLLPKHLVSKETKKTIKRNKTPFTWIHSIGSNNIPTNVQNGLDYYLNTMKGKAKYVLPLDRDIILGRCMIDRMKLTLDESYGNVAYTYVNFKFKGEVNMSFDAKPFNPNELLQQNYISSNSMIKIEALKNIGGFVIDNKYKRLLDWCLWIKFFSKYYIGQPCPKGSFIAVSSKDDVSAGPVEDFNIKKERVYNDFIKPIVEEHRQRQNPINKPTEVLTFGNEL